jgi:rare lipoprotein A (peptidoglycan hydrolase)
LRFEGVYSKKGNSVMDSVSYDISTTTDFDAPSDISPFEAVSSANRPASSVANNRRPVLRGRGVLGGILAATMAVAIGVFVCANGVARETPGPIAYVSPPHFVLEHAIFTQAGKGSWYGRWHQGRKTANGERFNMYQMTAAHRSLPLGTIVRVTNPATGKSVKVRINDRGPYYKGRVIDLSAAAARALGISKKGTARLQIEAFASDQTPG